MAIRGEPTVVMTFQLPYSASLHDASLYYHITFAFALLISWVFPSLSSLNGNVHDQMCILKSFFFFLVPSKHMKGVVLGWN